MNEAFEREELFHRKELLPELKLKYVPSPVENTCLDTPEKVVELLRKIFDPDTFHLNEEMILLFIDEDQRPIGFYRLAKGSKEQVLFSAKDIYRLLYLSCAQSFVMAHNHPSNSKYPSEADIELAFDLKTKVNYLGFHFADNIILTAEEYYSFKEKQMFWEYH